MPAGTRAILDRRTLDNSCGQLQPYLRSGLDVLDVGCGTGTITSGIALAVAPGRVVGVDISDSLLRHARPRGHAIAKLSFQKGDIYDLRFQGEFDLVLAARVLQWLSDPMSALVQLARACRPGGAIAIVDYTHTDAAWRPAPPGPFVYFYDRFLAWRATAGMDNRLGRHLPAMLRGLSAENITVRRADEISRRSQPHFEEAIKMWHYVIVTRGKQVVSDGFMLEHERLAADRSFLRWCRNDALEQRLHLSFVYGQLPGG